MQLFWKDKPFYRGNTHCHTTRSDGRRTPEKVIALYREAGYDFLALTDHRKLSEQAHFEGSLLMLPGMEMDFALPHEALHIIGIGMNESLMEACFSGMWRRTTAISTTATRAAATLWCRRRN